MGIVCYLLLLFLCFVFPKSRRMAVVIAVFLWILYGFNTYSGDYSNYENVYNNISTLYSGIEPGFAAVMMLCSKIGMSFTGFRLVLATIYVGLLFSAVIKLSDKPAVVIGLSVLFPSIYFISVLRSGIAFVILLNAIVALTKKKSYSVLEFVFLILVATSFHRSAIIFLIFVFAGKKINYKKLLLLFILAFFATIVMRKTELIEQFLKLFTNNDKILRWFDLSNTMHPNINGFIAISVTVSMLLLTEKLIYNKYMCLARMSPDRFTQSDSIYQVVNSVFSLSVIFIPLVLFADTFMRLFYSLLPLVFCVYTGIETGDYFNKKTGRFDISVYGLLSVALLAEMFLYADITFFGTPNDGLRVFQNNMIFGFNVS